jgi:hypothetical protein
MPSLKKKEKTNKAVDPISDRARVLNEQIAALESEIKRLDAQLHQVTAPKLRSTALPHGPTIVRAPEKANPFQSPAPGPAEREPVFEDVQPVHGTDDEAASGRFNDAGARRYDLPALVAGVRRWLSRPAPANPRLVRYLAAGGVRGLRPLRYEKRVARNRFIAWVIALLLLLLGFFAYLVRH